MMTTIKQQTTFKLAFMAALAIAGSGIGGAALAAQATATASGTVVAPIAITAASNLAFGSFSAGVGGSVTVSTSGLRTATGAIPIGAASTASAARFDISGQAGATYSISHSGTTVLTNGGATMALAKFSDLTGGNATAGNVATGTLDGLGAQSLFVGGTLTVAAGQLPGLYSGTVITTVEYN